MIIGSRFLNEKQMLFVGTLCPQCNTRTMEVIEIHPNDSVEAKCTRCRTRRFFSALNRGGLFDEHGVEKTPKPN